MVGGIYKRTPPKGDLELVWGKAIPCVPLRPIYSKGNIASVGYAMLERVAKLALERRF